MRDLPISMQNSNTPTPKIQSQTNIQVIQDNTQTLQESSNIQNPTPILLQQKSKITTNPFISETQKKIELQAIQDNANKIMTDFYNKNSTSSIKNLSLSDINKNTSESILGLLDDLLNKPQDIKWITYIQICLKKDNRYTYIGIIFIVIALYIMITKE